MPRDCTSAQPRSADFLDLLSLVSARIDVLGPAIKWPASRPVDLRACLQRGRFHLVVPERFKCGKSAILHALPGEEVLPTALGLLTAVPTFIQYGQTLQASAFLENAPTHSF